MIINPLLRSAAFRLNLKSRRRLFSLLFAACIFATPFIWAHTRSRSLAQTAAGAQAQAEKDVRRLEPGKPIKRELAGGQSHSYKITLAARQYLEAMVEQQGIDVVVALLGPDGKQIIEVDSPIGDFGREPVSWVVETGGDYRLTVRALDMNAPAGRYEVKVGELRTATDRDREVTEARKLFNEAVSLRGKYNYAEAIKLAERAMAIQEKVLGPEHPDVALSLNNLGGLYSEKGEYDKVEPLYQHALAILEKALGPEHPDVADSLHNIALLHRIKGDYDKAEQLYRRALAIHEKALGPEHLRVVFSLDKLASVLHHNKGDLAGAEPLYQRILANLEKVLGPEHPIVVGTLDTLANLYLSKGDYASAEKFYRRVLAVQEKVLGPEHTSVAGALNNLATALQRKSDYAGAEPLFQRSLAILEKAHGPEGLLVASALSNLALLYKDKGDYVRAEPLLQRSLAIWEKSPLNEHPDVANTLNNLATVYEDKGDYASAEPLYQRSLAIWEKSLGPEHTRVALSLNNLASLYNNKGDYDRAEQYHQRAIAIREKALGPEHPDVALSLNNLAVLYNDKGDYARAEPLIQRSLAIWEKSLGPEHPSVALSLHNLAKLYTDKGDYARAEPLFQRSLAIWEKALGPEHPDVATSLGNLGRLYWARGEMKQAVAFYRRSAEVVELNIDRNLVTGSERQKLAYLDTLSKQSSKIISLHIRSAPDDPAARDLAGATILRRKGRALDAMTDSIAALRRRATPEDQALLDQLKASRSQLARLALSGPQKTTTEEHRARIKALEEQIEKLEADISSRSAEFRALSRPVTIAAVQAAIPAGSVLVEFFVYRPSNPKARPGAAEAQPRYVAYVLRRAGKTRWVELGEAKVIDEAINNLRQALRDPSRRDVKRLARKVDRLVMNPLRPLLAPSRRVFLSTDGALNLVPFAALVDRAGHYLVKHYEFSYLTSGRDLLRLQAPRPDRRSAMVIANPDFGQSPSPGSKGGRAIKLQYQPGEGNRSSILSNAFFPPLPGTAEEANALKAMLPGAQILIKAQATESALKQAAGPGILHIATHGFFLPDAAASNESRDLLLSADNPTAGRVENPLLRSGLALAGANQRKTGAGREDDGVLTAEEASALDLRGTMLVILSACDTGVGEIRNGDGVYGLRRALALAGAETQVMSLWPVSDKATRDLMIAYYKMLLSGRGRSEALRATQLRMLSGAARASGGSSRILTIENGESARQTKTRQTRNYSHPYYWACFIQSGEWKKLDAQAPPSR